MTTSSQAVRECSTEQQPLLIVDDDLEIREVIQAVLQSEGYAVVTASDGEDALRQLGSGARPCVVLLDLRMPGMDGREFYRRMAEDPCIRDTPVVIVTGDHEGPQVAAVLGTECVMKPIDLERLLGIADRFCNHWPRASRTPRSASS